MNEKDIPSAKPAHDPPLGCEPYDLGGENDIGALSSEQQQQLNVFKTKLRIENERYLRQHPEVECLLSCFLQEVVKSRPNNTRDFAAEFFTNPELSKTIEDMLVERQKQLKLQQFVMKI